ncbi:thymine-DNA glycosylase [Malassezia obtusa]|uniref:Thymine-DNA glycosylase n=1 Tax=Malassezia obtusa TaxID=76774 RepID=A0AAF0IV51_9BASI|nr:thymine-DNA glycosylase [Malassezia obtusa]
MVRAPKRVTSRFFPPAPQRVPDYLEAHLDVLFCGINPGAESGAQQRHYAHRSNHFYTCVHQSGLTSERLQPTDDWTFPNQAPYRLGLTNLAHRPTARSEQLNQAELESGVPELIEKVRTYQPKVVCFVGKQIGQVFLRVLQQKKWADTHTVPLVVPPSVLGFWFDPKTDDSFPRKDAGYGVLPACVVHGEHVTLFFSTPSTSARVTHHQLPGKVRIMSHLIALLAAFPRVDTEPAHEGRLVHVPCIELV